MKQTKNLANLQGRLSREQMKHVIGGDDDDTLYNDGGGGSVCCSTDSDCPSSDSTWRRGCNNHITCLDGGWGKCMKVRVY